MSQLISAIRHRSITTWMVLAGLVLTALTGLWAVGGQRAVAQSGPTLRVTTTDDPEPGICAVGDCSLREAVITAGGQTGRTTIILPAGVHELTRATPMGDPDADDPVPGAADDERTGDLDVRGTVVLRGDGADRTAIDATPLAAAGAPDRVLEVLDGGDLGVQHLTVTGGAARMGGGIAVADGAALHLADAIVGGNGADERGGGILLGAGSTASVTRASLLDNSAGEFGGGISAAEGATLRIDASTVSGNGAGRDGGGLQLFGTTAALTSSTVSGNTALASGGGVLVQEGTLTIDATTITDNRALTGGAMIPVDVTVTVRRSAIAGNGAPGADCEVAFGVLLSQGRNAADGSCGLAAGDLATSDLALAPLADNGGPTPTHLPAAGSLLVDAIADCLPTDQRGAPRPADGDGDGVARCDIGAVERNAVVPIPPTPTPTEPPDPAPTDPSVPPATQPGTSVRLSGAERIATAIEISRFGFGDATAATVVLARSDEFADALSGTPLAVDRGGPLLLTTSTALRADVAEELQRVLAEGGEVILLGGTAALAPAVEAQVTALGFATSRLAGANRFATALAIATDGLGDPELLVAASGADFPDAVSAGAAAGVAGGGIVLTDADRLPDETAAYLRTRAEAEVIAVGGPAAAALPGETALVGATRIETAIAVAERFYPDGYDVAGLATARAFPDALAGGALLGHLGGPMLLSEPEGLPTGLRDHLQAVRPPLSQLLLMGGPAALSPAVEAAVQEVLR